MRFRKQETMLAIMLRRFILYTMFNYLFLFSIYSQSKTYSIQGKITNSSNISIAYSTIILKKELDSTIVSGSVTDSIGEFKLVSIPQNKYYVTVSSIGYQSQSFPLFLKKDTISLKVTDVFLTQQECVILNQYILNSQYHNTRGLSLSFSYNLEKGTKISKKIIHAGNEEEKNRVN